MDLKLDKIDWAQTDEEQIYDIYDNLDLATDKVEMVLHLMENHPIIELGYIEMIEETTSELLFNHKHELVEKMVNTYAKYFPKEYANDYQYLENDLLDYFFYVDNIEKIEERLVYIKMHPVNGVDLVTIPVLYQLIYNGYFSQALEYSKLVWEPLYNSDEIWGNAHAPFCTTIYLHELEQAYNRIQDGQSVDVNGFYDEINKTFEIDEDDDGKQTIFYCLQHSFSKDEIDSHIKEHEYRKANLKMNIWFLVYMNQKFNVPFMLSDRWWNLLSATNIFGQNGENDYWYVPYNTLDEHFFKHTDNMLGSDQLEMFGKVKALEYVYHFINECKLISEPSYKLMSENIIALNYVYTEYSVTDLWQMIFIFKWPQLYYPDPSKEKIYRDTFCNDNSEMIVFRNSQNLIFNMFRPDLQAKIREKNKDIFDDLYDIDEDDEYYYPNETYVREEPKISRNDPCPCGSGKKYKKCCLKN